MLDRKIRQCNHIKFAAYLCSWLLHLASSVLAAMLVGALAQVLHSPSPLVHTLLCVSIFLLVFSCVHRRARKITRSALLLTLDRAHATTTPAPYALRRDTHADKIWREPLRKWQNKIVRLETRRVLAVAGRTAGLLLALAVVAWRADLSPRQLLPAYHYLATLTPLRATLTVLPARKRHYELQTDTPPQIKMSQHEMALIVVASTALTQNPVLQLRAAGEVWQEVQLRPQTTAPGHYAVTLNIDRSSTLHLNAIAASATLATIDVAASRAPQVKLSAQQQIETPHPDNIPLPLLISTTSTSPLASIKLMVTTKEGTYEELVNTIMTTRRTHTASYRFMPEPYMESDVAELELVATAHDRNGTIGYSAPLLINAISAWGRYRHTLEKLKEVKTMLDEKLNQPHHGVDVNDIHQTMQAAVATADTSPFFHAFDRLTMDNLLVKLEANKDLQRRRELVAVAEKLNEFLREHEMIDSRERDRDFFTAARHLSWIIARGDQPIDKHVQRLDKFLRSRREHWQQRVENLPAAQRPPRWAEIAESEPFREGLSQLPALSPVQARDELTALVGAYRAWLDELEKAEDTHYEQSVQQAQQVLQAAQNDLRALQQRQTHISTYLDKAAQRQTEELQRGWAATRMRQNTNISTAKSLLQQLRAVSPLAAQRLQDAVQAMQGTVSNGEKQEFVAAESLSDLAGRLLRYTHAATQQRLPSRRQRRRRTAGDRYHGRPVIGGYIELQRDYRVNERYREDILEAIRRSDLLEKHRNLLDAYLRRAIR